MIVDNLLFIVRELIGIKLINVYRTVYNQQSSGVGTYGNWKSLGLKNMNTQVLDVSNKHSCRVEFLVYDRSVQVCDKNFNKVGLEFLASDRIKYFCDTEFCYADSCYVDIEQTGFQDWNVWIYVDSTGTMRIYNPDTDENNKPAGASQVGLTFTNGYKQDGESSKCCRAPLTTDVSASCVSSKLVLDALLGYICDQINCYEIDYNYVGEIGFSHINWDSIGL